MEPILELGDHAEIAAPAAHRPEQIRVLARARVQHLAVRAHDLDRLQVVASQAVLAHQATHPAAQCQPGDARVRRGSQRGGESHRLHLAIELAQQHAALRPTETSLRVDLDSLHGRHIDHQPAVASGLTRKAVAAPAHRREQLMRPRERDCPDNIIHPGAPRDQRRVAIKHRVPKPASLIVARVLREQHLAVKARAQVLDVGCAQRDGLPRTRHSRQ